MASIYQKIPGVGTGRSGFQIASRSRLYTTPDHLFIVQSTGFTEEYKRLFFRDIRSVEVRHTNAQTWIAVISAVITLLLALLIFTPMPGWLVALFCAPFVVWFVMNLVRGPTCQCSISSSVQTLKLPAPKRVKQVPAMIAYLRAQTAAVQVVETPQPVA